PTPSSQASADVARLRLGRKPVNWTHADRVRLRLLPDILLSQFKLVRSIDSAVCRHVNHHPRRQSLAEQLQPARRTLISLSGEHNNNVRTFRLINDQEAA